MAGAWKLSGKALKKLGNGLINLSGNFRLRLLTTMSGVTGASLAASLANYASFGLYSASGKAITGDSWTLTGTTTMKFAFSNVAIKASGGAMNGIKGAAVVCSGAAPGDLHVVCYSTLTSTGTISLSDQSTLTITPAATGVFIMY